MNQTPSFENFENLWRAGKHQVVWTQWVSDLETPVSAMLKLGQEKPYTFLLESIEGGAIRGRYSFIGLEPDIIWRCRDGKAEINRDALRDLTAFAPVSRPPIEDFRALLAESRIDTPDQPQPMAAGLFGYLGYDMVRCLERLPAPKGQGLDVPDSIMVRPTILAIFDQIENCFTLVTPVWFDAKRTAQEAYEGAIDRLQRAQASMEKALPIQPAPILPAPANAPANDAAEPACTMTEAEYVDMVEKAKAYIRAGDCFQIVLSRRFSVPFNQPAFDLYRAVRRLDPSPYLFYFNFGAFQLVGSSPEALVRVREGKITIRPIAGTRPRGMGNQTDDELTADLLSDPKELAEHLMLVDLGRNDVGRFAKTGTVRVTERNVIEKYRHVLHIVSNVEGELDTRYSALDAVLGGFPAGTVSGAPKIRAMEIIAELEPDRRSTYAGCIGYFGANNNADSCIAIRTALVKDGLVNIQAGAGIVYDSNPHSEYKETAAKARGMLRAVEIAQGKK